MEALSPSIISLLRALTFCHVVSILSAGHIEPGSWLSGGVGPEVKLGRRIRHVRSAGDLSHGGQSSRADPLAALDLVERVQKQHDNCSASVTLDMLRDGFPEESYARFSAQEATAIKTANVLNNLFRFRGTNLQDEYFYSLARAAVQGDPLVEGSAIAFDRGQYDGGDFCPAIFRQNDGLVAVDLSRVTRGMYAVNGTAGYEWFWKHRHRDYSSDIFGHECQQINPYTGTGEVGKAGRRSLPNDVVLSTTSLGLWSRPYYDCGGSNSWIVTYSVPFFGCQGNDNQLMFKGVVAVSIDLHKMDINQCANDGSLFSNTHKCRQSTTCHHVPGMGFRRGGYQCKCHEGFYFSSSIPGAPQYFNGSTLEEQHQRHLVNDSLDSEEHFTCLPCKAGCPTCTGPAPCLAHYDVMRRGIPLGIQSFCMTISLVLGLVILRLRKSKVMKASMWFMLEILLVGALLLYSTVLIQYFEPSTATCLLIPWFREVGFAVVYGALILKIYRVLLEFQSRRANRVHVRDQDLLKYLLGVVLVVVGYMSAWTAVNMDHVREGGNMLDEGTTPDQLKYYICKAFWWDYVIEIGEFLFLFFGIYLCYCVRQAPSSYGEIRFISIAIYLETIVSAFLHILRHFIWLVIHPDYIFLMYFIRCQLTVTVALIVVLGPKLWYAHRPPEDEHFRNRAYSSSDVHDTILPESMKLHVGISSNGDVDVGEINLAEMDPEDIRAELKRLYTQLQIYKTKTMRKDNPHISKRRGGRKQTHRRFSLQAFHYKHRHHHAPEHDHDHELSKTPEESTNSAEGVAIQMEGSSRGDEERTPTVTFKPGHKSFS